MTTNAGRGIAAENQRRRIPDKWAIQFTEFTNEEIKWLASEAVSLEVRAYAAWEAEYREAYGIEMYLDYETAQLKRRRR